MLTRIELLDELLDRHAEALGADLVAYRNHNYRVVNFCAALSNQEPQSIQKMAIAAAFHDIGIWTDLTFDYLDPSESRALAYLAQTGRQDWAPEIGAMIQEHHRVTAAKSQAGVLVDAFRKADWIDVSLGMIRFGLSRRFVGEVRAAFPNAGFHKRLVQLSLRQWSTRPWDPMPMMKW